MSFQELKVHGTHDFPLELYHIEESHPKYEMAFHWHHNIELIRVLKGSMTIFLDNRKYTAKTGDLIFVNSEIIHGAYPENCIYECVVYDGLFVPNLYVRGRSFSEVTASGQIQVNEYFPAENDDLHRFSDGIFDEMKAKDDGKYYRVISMLCGFYGVILKDSLYIESCGEISEASQKLKIVLKYIREAYENPITLYDMSQIAGLSPKYFCTYFKRLTGKTPIDYLVTYRIERASRRLINTDDPVTDIALSTGFNDLSYFIKTFKNIKGVTPNTFRKAYRIPLI
ncbi:MAG: AraC family transcriptional regulator [Firmicutes bacterium]|nr:AraC family transcriptional regulator [Bacillota bacterium]